MFDTRNITLNAISEFYKYLENVPFKVSCTRLYNTSDLFDAFDAQDSESFERCYDTVVYNHVCKLGKITHHTMEMQARSMHDCSILKCLKDFLAGYEESMVVGIMGGHAMKRTDAAYRQTVEISKILTERGYLMISGGGPGAMEATHLGAWMAGRSDDEVADALCTISKAPTFKDKGWLASAFEVLKKYPLESKYKSLAIPTWFYGHEPPCAFATHVAKFFDNSIREDQILTVSFGGLIYMPGSAGTVQEIFQEAVQDHYLSLGYASPMVFVGKDYWTEEVPVFPFMKHMMQNGHYKNLLLSIVDDTDSIVQSIEDFESIYKSLPAECKQR